MALSHKLELRHSQSLVMTPQLMQAIKLLQLSNLDLVAYVDAELERNPLLERGESEEAGEAPEEPAGNGESHEAGESDGDWLETRLETDTRSIEAKLDTDLANVFPDDNGRAQAETPPVLPTESWSSAPSRQAVSSEDYNLEAFVASEKTLAEHLSDQLGLTVADPMQRL